MLLKKCQTFRFGSFLIDVPQRTLSFGGNPVPIAPKAFDGLVLLAENAGTLVDRATLRDRIWPGQIVEEGTIARLMADVRKALGDSDEERLPPFRECPRPRRRPLPAPGPL